MFSHCTEDSQISCASSALPLSPQIKCVFWAYLNIHTQHIWFPPRSLSPILCSLFQLVTIHSVPAPGPRHFLLFLLTHLPHHISGQVLSLLPPKYFLNLLSPPYEQRLCQALIISQQTKETVSFLMMCLKPDFLFPKDFTQSPEPFVEIFLLPSLICIAAFIKQYIFIYTGILSLKHLCCFIAPSVCYVSPTVLLIRFWCILNYI